MLRKTLICIVLGSLLVGCKSKVDQAKNYIWEGDKALTLGKALDNYKWFEKTSWKLKKTENGKEYVEFVGTLLPPSSKIELATNALQTVPRIKKQIENNIGAENYYYNVLLRSSGSTDDVLTKWALNRHNIKEDGTDFRSSVNNFNSTGDDARRVRYEELNTSLDNYENAANKLMAFYAQDNRMQVIYQLVINEDKTVNFGGFGCKSLKDDTVNDMPIDPLSTLYKIYQNEPIDTVCPEPI